MSEFGKLNRYDVYWTAMAAVRRSIIKHRSILRTATRERTRRRHAESLQRHEIALRVLAIEARSMTLSQSQEEVS